MTVSNLFHYMFYNFVLVSVDLLQSGCSDLNVFVLCNDKIVPCTVKDSGVERKKVSFTPSETGHYKVSIYNGGVEITGLFIFFITR